MINNYIYNPHCNIQFQETAVVRIVSRGRSICGTSTVSEGSSFNYDEGRFQFKIEN